MPEITVEELQEFANKTTKAIQEFLQPIINSALDWCKQVYDSLYGEYINAGAKYGETHEGFIHWLQDKQEELEKGK